MDVIIESLTARPIITVGVGAFLCGVALFYLVMQRTRRHRIRQMQQRGN